jgi:hypothetical protein
MRGRYTSQSCNAEERSSILLPDPACYTRAMYATFCDSCKDKISAEDGNALSVKHRHDWYLLCGACSAGLLETLKDMRLINELDGIR